MTNPRFNPTQVQSVLEVTSLEVKEASDSRAYKLTTFSYIPMVAHPLLPGVILEGKPVSIRKNIWERDSDAIGGKLNAFYPRIEEGKHIMGSIIKHETNPYEIEDKDNEIVRTVNRASTIVFGDSTQPNWHDIIIDAFQDMGLELAYTGEVINEEKELEVSVENAAEAAQLAATE